MKVRITKHCDIGEGDAKRALFEGDEYDIPADEAKALIAAKCAVSLAPKAKKGPPEDKAKRSRGNK